MFNKIKNKYQSFIKNKKGAIAIEFAILMPIMIALYLGNNEISNAISIDRKVSHVSSVVADLVARSKTVTRSDIYGIYEAAEAIMYPYTTRRLSITLAQITYNGMLDYDVLIWETYNGGAGVLDIYSIPGRAPGKTITYVTAKAEYRYKPNFGSAIIKEYKLRAIHHFTPRGAPVKFKN